MWGLILTLAFLPQANAGRTTAVMPIVMDTVHGGSDGTQFSYCISADMNQTVAGVGPNGRVAVAFHRYALSFRNLSDIVQTVKIVLEAGSKITSNYSTNQPAPDLPGKTLTLTSARTLTVQLNPKEGKKFDVIWFCSTRRCWLDSSAGTLLGTSDYNAPRAAICLAIQSELQMTLTVDQDRGAVIGSIATSSHRGFGYADKYNEPPPFVLINGGRPF